MVETPRAFPQNDWPFAGGDGSEIMTLRDWFAGQALAGVMAYSGNGYGKQTLSAEAIASICGRIADAMLVERPK